MMTNATTAREITLEMNNKTCALRAHTEGLAAYAVAFALVDAEYTRDEVTAKINDFENPTEEMIKEYMTGMANDLFFPETHTRDEALDHFKARAEEEENDLRQINKDIRLLRSLLESSFEIRKAYDHIWDIIN